VDMRVALVPAGQFQRSGKSGTHAIRFRRGLEVSITEVTAGQFRRFVEATQYRSVAETAERPGAEVFDGKGFRWDPEACWDRCGLSAADLPVTCVAWEDAVAFCNWLSEQERLRPCYYKRPEGGWGCDFTAPGFRLPTSAEWEHFARSGPALLLPGPASALEERGWFRPNSDGRPHPVGQKKPNRHKLCDVWGNVWEWCWDWYEARLPERAAEDPTGPPSGEQRTVWGGSWYEEPAAMSGGGARRGLPPDHRSTAVGFRVVRGMGGQ
ncbi:MAG TPA: SUMF1/EgtB/PvdO family nonheme iron enzyme, partial [Gemmataceae bacterium]|nr:SUMF1/EgtB/PvdO family nonheme iron enzyme [Gemmataceae bacterium]